MSTTTFTHHHSSVASDYLIGISQRLIDQGRAQLDSLYFRRVRGVSHRTICLKLPGHTGILRLVDAGSGVTCHYDDPED